MPNEPWGPDTAELWRKAWGTDKAVVVTGYEARMPRLPDGYDWLVTRDLDIVRRTDADGNEVVDLFPKVEVSLLHGFDSHDGFRTVALQVLDVKTYGESPVGLAETMADYAGLVPRIR